MDNDPEYVAARGVLLDALQALQPHIASIVIVGAQAVYLRTDAVPGIAAHTTDADLVIDPTGLSENPDLGSVMETAGFRLYVKSDGIEEPGIWVRSTTVEGMSVDVPVDLIVPKGAASGEGRRSARLPGHSHRAARKVEGLEAALIDHDELRISSLDGSDQRNFVVKVAGPAALLIAKAYKLSDRLRSRNRPDRLKEKDAGDVYRLMRSTNRADVISSVARLIAHPDLGEICRTGLQTTVDLFQRGRSPGTLMAISHMRGAVSEETIRSVCISFAIELRAALPTA